MSISCTSYGAELRVARKGQCDACEGDPVLQYQGYPLCLECAVKSVKAIAGVIALQGAVGAKESAAKAAHRELREFFGVKRALDRGARGRE